MCNWRFFKFLTDLSLIDWSSQNMLAVALGSSVYLWNASKGEITLLQQSEIGGDYVSCVNWTADGNHLAVGLSSGCVEVILSLIVFN